MLNMREILSNKSPVAPHVPEPSISEDEAKAELERVDAEFAAAYEAGDEQLMTSVRVKRDALQLALSNAQREREIIARITAKRNADGVEKSRVDRVEQMAADGVRVRAGLIQATQALVGQAGLVRAAYAEYKAAKGDYTAHSDRLLANGEEFEPVLPVERLDSGFIGTVASLAEVVDNLDQFRTWLADAKTLDEATRREYKKHPTVAPVPIISVIGGVPSVEVDNSGGVIEPYRRASRLL